MKNLFLRNSLYSFIIVLSLFSRSYADDSVVARVNGIPIAAKNLEIAVNAMIPRMVYHGNVSEEKRDELRQKALDELIDRELQYQDGVAKGIKPEKKLVNERIEQVRSQFKSKKEFKQALKEAGINEDQLREINEKALVREMNIRKTVIEPARMSDAMLREYYEKNIDKFKQPEAVHLRLISAKEEKKAREAYAAIKGGSDFGDVAARFSENDYRIKGGDLGLIHRGRILPELEAKAFKLKPGETSDPAKVDGVWYIMKVEDKQAERLMTFEESKAKLKKELEDKRIAELNQKLVAELRSKAKIELFWKPASSEE